jgi:hypothetical protein
MPKPRVGLWENLRFVLFSACTKSTALIRNQYQAAWQMALEESSFGRPSEVLYFSATFPPRSGLLTYGMHFKIIDNQHYN